MAETDVPVLEAETKRKEIHPGGHREQSPGTIAERKMRTVREISTHFLRLQALRVRYPGEIQPDLGQEAQEMSGLLHEARQTTDRFLGSRTPRPGNT